MCSSDLLSSHVMHEVESTATHVAIILRGRLVLVDEIASLRQRMQRTLVFDFDHDVDSHQFERCSNVMSASVNGRSITCSVVGSEASVLKLAAEFGAHTVTTSEPSLEELFYSVTGTRDVQ